MEASVRWAACRNTGQHTAALHCHQMENKLYQRHHTLSTVKNLTPQKRSQVSWTFCRKSMISCCCHLTQIIVSIHFCTLTHQYIFSMNGGGSTIIDLCPSDITGGWCLLVTWVSCRSAGGATPWTQIIDAVTLIIMKTLLPAMQSAGPRTKYRWIHHFLV